MASWGVMGAMGLATLGVVVLSVPGTQSRTAAAADLPSPSVIAIQDDGKTFSYPLGALFSVRLDKELYPPEEVTCTPKGIIAKTKTAPEAKKWMGSTGFQAVASGECELTVGDFVAHIQVRGEEGESVRGIPSGVRGLVTKGPLCAIQLGERACPDVPYQTTVGIFKKETVNDAGVRPFAKLATGADGEFETRLPPGEYVVRAGLPIQEGGATEFPCNWASVTVAPNAVATVVLQCDTGIR